MRKALSIGLVSAGLVAAAFGGNAVHAYAKNKGEWQQKSAERMDHRIDRLKEKLDLSADQETKIRAAFQDQQTKIQAIREETRKKVAAVLTPEQKAKFESLKKEHKKDR